MGRWTEEGGADEVMEGSSRRPPPGPFHEDPPSSFLSWDSRSSAGPSKVDPAASSFCRGRVQSGGREVMTW